jgi:glycosyltransferase involved in cell wall biosynthesis
MLSVVIATENAERVLVPTLAALVPGATAGIVREVIVADAGSSDATAMIADAAGCRIDVMPQPLGHRLRQAAASARAPWLLFLRPGAVPDWTWIEETRRFIEQAELGGRADTRAAAFRRTLEADTLGSAIVEGLGLIAATLGARPRPQQGLLISKKLYERFGGHLGEDADPEGKFLRRLGRRRIVMLRSRTMMAGTGSF